MRLLLLRAMERTAPARIPQAQVKTICEMNKENSKISGIV